MQLSEAIGGHALHVNALDVHVTIGRETHSVYNLALSLSCEEARNLVENLCHSQDGRRHLAELPVLGRAPEEGSLGEASVAKAVHADGDEVVRVNA